MPELGEVAHASSILRKFLLDKAIKSVDTTVDDKVFVAPLTNKTFEKELTGQQVTDIGRHGKYFWFRFDNDKVMLMHFGMTGWVKVRDIVTHFIVMENGGDKTAKERYKDEGAKKEYAEMETKFVKDEVWPPKFYKFVLKLDDDSEIAFLDPRRLGKLRLLSAKTDDALMAMDPLSKLGLDFSKPEDRWDLETFSQKVTKRRVCIKTLLMDQAVFSGIGNWVADEICYQARLHPEVLASELTEEQLKTLYDTVVDICEYVVKIEGNTAAFPDHWLMLYRWGKRNKKEKDKTPDGYVVQHITVGGRTAAFVPELQKKSGDNGSKRKAATPTKTTTKKQKVKKEQDESENESDDVPTPQRTTRSGRVSKRSSLA